MKKIYLIVFALILLAGCQDAYEFNPGFSVPTVFHSPESVQVDLTSTRNIVFSWEGGKAEDGGIVLYEVLFDKESGDFSQPLYFSKSDMGANPQLTLTPVVLNKIARSAGTKIGESVRLKWTVKASRGGVVKMAEGEGKITVTRPLEEIPEQLYLYGTATENGGSAGVQFRMVSDGVFVIYTRLAAGTLLFADSMEEEAVYYALDDSGKLIEGHEGVEVAGYEVPVRLTVNFNTKKMTIDQISGIRMIWGASYTTIANLSYTGNGVFEAPDTKIVFLGPGRPDTPDWCGWVEERYYFIATINGVEVCWGRMDGISTERPSDNESPKFYELGEFAWSQWDHLWKMGGNLDLKTCTVAIQTNLDGLMVHQFNNVR